MQHVLTVNYTHMFVYEIMDTGYINLSNSTVTKSYLCSLISVKIHGLISAPLKKSRKRVIQSPEIQEKATWQPR